MARLLTDIALVSAQVGTLNNAVTNFPITGGTSIQALAVHNEIAPLIVTINQATTDANNTPQPSDSDSQTILNSLQNIVPGITSGLQAVVDKKGILQSISFPPGFLPSIVKQDLANLHTATTAFQTAFMAKAPTDLKSQAQSIVDTVNTALDAAQSAYAEF